MEEYFNSPITESYASGDEINKVITAMQPIIDGFSTSHVLIACLSLAFLLQNPDLEPEELQKAVKDASQWIALYLSNLEDGMQFGDEIPKERMN